MSHTTYLVRPDDHHPEIVEALVIHNSDWSGDAELRWWPRLAAGHAGARHDQTVPGALAKALITHGAADFKGRIFELAESLGWKERT